METFEYNDCGVCTNPETIYYFMPPKALAWAYTEITVASRDGLWDYGYSSLGGGCAPSQWKFASKEDAVEKAIELLSNSLNSDSGLLSDKSAYLHHFETWNANRNQLCLFA